MIEANNSRTDTGSGPPQSVLRRIQKLNGTTSDALSRVAQEVLSDPIAAARSTIVELAERSNTSPATITRFCRSAGYSGYAALRVALATDTGRAQALSPDGWQLDIGQRITSDDPLDHMLAQVVQAEVHAIRETASGLDIGAITEAARAVTRARRVDLYGVGGSAVVLGSLHMGLHRIGIPVWIWQEIHSALASAAQLSDNDVAIAFSHSGATVETIEMLAEATSRGALTVAVTSFADSAITEVADIVLRSSTQASTSRADVMAARHSQLLVADVLYLAVAQQTIATAESSFETTAHAVAGHRRHPIRQPGQAAAGWNRRGLDG